MVSFQTIHNIFSRGIKVRELTNLNDVTIKCVYYLHVYFNILAKIKTVTKVQKLNTCKIWYSQNYVALQYIDIYKRPHHNNMYLISDPPPHHNSVIVIVPIPRYILMDRYSYIVVFRYIAMSYVLALKRGNWKP